MAFTLTRAEEVNAPVACIGTSLRDLWVIEKVNKVNLKYIA